MPSKYLRGYTKSEIRETRESIRALQTAQRDPEEAYRLARVHVLKERAKRRRRPYTGATVGNVEARHRAGGMP